MGTQYFRPRSGFSCSAGSCPARVALPADGGSAAPPGALHRWDIPPREAVALQRELRNRLLTVPIRGRVNLVAGGDIAYSRRDELLFAAVVLIRLPEMETVEQSVVTRRAEYPYVPGLLSFREAPALLEAFSRLTWRPDAVLVDGQGQAHPRGLGIAAHLGLWLDLPTIGCAKSRLCGEHEEPGPKPGDHAPLIFDGKTVGAVLRTKKGVKPLFISAGHLSNLRDAIRIVLRCCAGHRLPRADPPKPPPRHQPARRP